MENRLSKIDVARRQLVTAIRLFFANGDPVSVFTLAANAWEVIDALCHKRGVASTSNKTRGHIPVGEDLKRDYVNDPFRNFFKHADRDTESSISGFDERKSDGIIFLGVEDYIRLNGKSPIEFQVFQIWYLAVNIEKVSQDSFVKISDAADRIFPNVRELSRDEQILLGAKVLEQARADKSVLGDPRTEDAL